MTYSDWFSSPVGYVNYVRTNTARLLADAGFKDLLSIEENASPSDTLSNLEALVMSLLAILNKHFGLRTLLPDGYEFVDRLTLILADVIPEYFNQLAKYKFSGDYHNPENFGYTSKVNDISADGNLPVAGNINDYAVSTNLTHGFNKSQNLTTDTSYDLQEVVRRNLSYSAFWRLNIFSIVINRIEPLFVGLVAHEY